MAGFGSPAVWPCGMRAIASRAARRLTGPSPTSGGPRAFSGEKDPVRRRRCVLSKGSQRARSTALALVVASLAGPACAVQPDEVLPDPVLERRARDISAELRCLVCQNQSIDDSDAPLAKDLRVLVRERLKAGDNNAEVRDFVVQRYGEFVLLKPTFGLHTALLWLGPALILGAGALSLIIILRRRHANVAAPLSADERAALDKLLRRDRPPP